jgi:hypothetical protein
MRTLTERIAKRIRRGQPWGRSAVDDATLVRWAEQYALRAGEALMAEETAAPGEDPVVVRARKRMEQAIEAESKNREKQKDDMRFLAATSDEPEYQWPTIDPEPAPLPGTAGFNRPTFVINKMRSHQNQVLNEQRMNRPQIKVRPADSKASKEVAKALNGWLRHVQVASEADLAYDTACMWQTGGGEGFFRMYTEFCDEMSLNQEVVFAPLPDRFKVYLDPIGLRQHPAGRKCRWGFIVEDLPKDEYESIYGEEHAVDWNLTGVGDMVNWFQQQHTVRVAEYFEIESATGRCASGRRPTATATALTGSPTEKSYIKQGWVKTGRERKTKIPRCIWRKMNGQKVIGKPKEMPTRFIPIIRVAGNEFVIDGELHVDGMVRPAKDAQRTFNYNRSKEAEVNALAPLAPITAAVDQIKGHEAIYEKANDTPVAYLPYNLVRNDDESIVAIAPPARVAPPMPPAALIQASINADQDIKATMGQWGPALGEPSSEKAARRSTRARSSPTWARSTTWTTCAGRFATPARSRSTWAPRSSTRGSSCASSGKTGSRTTSSSTRIRRCRTGKSRARTARRCASTTSRSGSTRSTSTRGELHHPARRGGRVPDERRAVGEGPGDGEHAHLPGDEESGLGRRRGSGDGAEGAPAAAGAAGARAAGWRAGDSARAQADDRPAEAARSAT